MFFFYFFAVFFGLASACFKDASTSLLKPSCSIAPAIWVPTPRDISSYCRKRWEALGSLAYPTQSRKRRSLFLLRAFSGKASRSRLCGRLRCSLISKKNVENGECEGDTLGARLNKLTIGCALKSSTSLNDRARGKVMTTRHVSSLVFLQLRSVFAVGEGNVRALSGAWLFQLDVCRILLLMMTWRSLRIYFLAASEKDS